MVIWNNIRIFFYQNSINKGEKGWTHILFTCNVLENPWFEQNCHFEAFTMLNMVKSSKKRSEQMTLIMVFTQVIRWKKLSLGSEGKSSCYNINKTIPCVYRAPHNRRFIPLSGGDSPFRYSDCTCPTSGWEQTWSCCHLVLEFGSVLS